MGPIEGKPIRLATWLPPKLRDQPRPLGELLSYIRYAWGKEGDCIEKDLVSKVRKKHEKRSAPWTDRELKGLE